MLKRLKAMKPRTKIILGCFLALAIYGALQPQPTPPSPSHYYPNQDGRVVPGPQGDDQNNQALAQLEARRDELAPKVQECMDESTRATNEMGAAAVNGVIMNNRPPCEQYVNQWAMELNVVNTEIYRLKTGDTHSSFNQLNGVSPRSGGGSVPSYYQPTAPSDDGTHAVDNWDRGAIRGTTMYKDENGEEKELPTADYYYHDLETGQYVPSDSSTAPNDGHDYEPMTPEN